jgi:hypothetical protein
MDTQPIWDAFSTGNFYGYAAHMGRLQHWELLWIRSPYGTSSAPGTSMDTQPIWDAFGAAKFLRDWFVEQNLKRRALLSERWTHNAVGVRRLSD